MTRRSIATFTVGVAIVLAACGSSGSDSAGSDSPGSGSAATDPAVTDPSAAEPDESDAGAGTAGAAAEEAPDTTVSDIDAADAVQELDARVRDATSPWPTDWGMHTIALDELRLGIPTTDPRDRIPPIDAPTFEPLAAADWLESQDPGALVQLDGEVRFYPLAILTRHEIVNDRFGDRPVVVSYCPLCNTAITFEATVDGQELRFGVSGLLRNSDLVMWDDATTSLWQQITGEAIVGDFAGAQLDLIPTSIVSYGDALDNFPDAFALSRDTGFGIEYGRNPYTGYSSSPSPFLFDGELDDRFPALSRVVGVTIDDAAKAYPFSVLEQQQAVNDEVGGVPIAVLWGGDTADALDSTDISEGQAVGSGIAYDRRIDGDVLTFTPNDDGTFTDAETGSTWTLLGRATAGPLEGSQLDTVIHRNEFWFAWAAFFPDAPVYS